MTDEDVPKSIVRGLRRRRPNIDIVRVQEIGLQSKDDTTILEHSAAEGRVLITRDRQTMIGSAYERAVAGESMPGLIVLDEEIGIGEAVEEILMTAVCCAEIELQNRVVYLPL